MKTLGIISDTHGLLRPQACAALDGSDLILHAGDIGRPEVLEQLARIAPVRAIRGNNDEAPWARHLPATERIEFGGLTLYMLHNLKELDVDPVGAGVDIVIAGHSHKPLIERRGAVLYLNPGSAGPRRFKLPVTIARMTIARGAVEAQIIELAVAPTR